MPTFARLARFDREFRRLPRELQRAFLAVLPVFIEALRSSPPDFPPALRIKRVQGTAFEFGSEIRPGEPHIVWRRVGIHDVLSDP